MNIFKGMLYLHGYLAQPDPSEHRLHYGASTADEDFVAPLGNHAASVARFGDSGALRSDRSGEVGCVAGACG